MKQRFSGARRNRAALGCWAIACLPLAALAEEKAPAPASSAPARQTLEEARVTMDKWIETQQIISKESKDWQQGKDILVGRLDLVKKEIAALGEKIEKARASVAESDKKRADLLAEGDQHTAAEKQLKDAVTGMEGKIRAIFPQLPEPIQTKLLPLYQRVPEDAAATRVSIAERFQNVLGILNELNKANNEITVSYEVHKLLSGTPAEVRAIYVGLAQAYFVSAQGEAGIGRPTLKGWVWEAAPAAAHDITTTLEILDGKHTPAFVPLPVKIQ